MQNNKIVELRGVSKAFEENGARVQILEGLNLEIWEGQKVAIVGPSGSGKSTILSLIAGLDTPDAGEVLFEGRAVNKMSERELALYRNNDIGIIFQSFELILPFTVRENISAPQEIKKDLKHEVINNLINEVNLNNKSESAVTNLSGGEKQRVAIARALSNNPKLILADEPTGSLDSATGKRVLEILISLAEKENKTLIIITHDEGIAGRMDKVYQLVDKKLIEQ